MNCTIRALLPGELAFAAECTAAEGWVSENISTLEGFFRHDPAGCLVAELAGRPVGICIATAYGTAGFIGELIVRPEARGCGTGAALLNHAMTYLVESGAQTIYLDGVIQAVSLYERNGFRKVCRSLRLAGQLAGKSHPAVRPLQAGDLQEVCALDRRAFGADRSFFLHRRWELFPDLSHVLVMSGRLSGFILGRAGEGWAAAGPWVMVEGAGAARLLLESFADALGGTPFTIGVLETNQPAVELLRGMGLCERTDSPWRMARGPGEDLGASAACYAIGSAAKG